MNLNLQAKAALVTGGSRGIGKAIAMALAAEGARVAICGRDEVVLEQARDEIIAQTRAEVICVKANMAKINDIRRFISAAVKKFNRIDILINNAGGGPTGDIDEITDETWEEYIQLKLLGYVRVAREALPYMRQNGGGRIINIAGTSGREPGSRHIMQGVVNAGIISFTKGLSRALERDKIVVNAVNPGTTDTQLTTKMIESLAAASQKNPDEIRQSLLSVLPFNRFATADDIARVAVFLASDAAAFINGVSVNVDAGKTAGV